MLKKIMNGVQMFKQTLNIILILVFVCFISASNADTQLNPSYTGDTQIQGRIGGDLHFNYNFPTVGTGATTTTTTSTTSTITTTTTIKPIEQSGGSSGSYGGGAASGTGLGTTGVGVSGIEPGVGLIPIVKESLEEEAPYLIDFGKIVEEDSKKSFLNLIRKPFNKISGAVTATQDLNIFGKIKYYNSNFINNIKGFFNYIVKKILKK